MIVVTQAELDEIIVNLKAHSGEWVLVKERLTNGYPDHLMRKAGMEIERERIDASYYDLYARWPLPEHQHH
jgi:hypothetical protein